MNDLYKFYEPELLRRDIFRECRERCAATRSSHARALEWSDASR